MIKAELQRGDGLNSGRVWLESVVRNAQLALVDAGYLSTADGKFGRGTEKQLKLFQAAAGIDGSPGVVDQKTWQALQPNLNIHLRPLESLIANREWQQVATTVAKMQQNHELKGIRVRRRHEGSLVRAELDFLQSNT